jgi:uncharacterized protein (UPF0218 family)
MSKRAKDEPTLLLSEKLRAHLKRPLGQLFPDIATAVEHLRKLRPTRLITVGDVATAKFIAAGVRPDVAVVDFLVMRKPVAEDLKARIDSLDARVIHVRNPAGTLTPEMRESFADAKPPLKIIVEGEEDLATVPAVLSAPQGSVVVYGQPGGGVVIIKVTESKRREFTDLLKEFKATYER